MTSPLFSTGQGSSEGIGLLEDSVQPEGIPDSIWNYQQPNITASSLPIQYIAPKSLLNIKPASSFSTGKKGGTVGSGPVLWKPVSEKDKNLVVLTPAGWGQQSAGIYGPNNNLISASTGFSFSNPNRPTYRFPNPGAFYQPGSRLKIGNRYFSVSSPGQRSMLSPV